MLDTPEWTERLRPSHPHALSKVRQLYLSLYEAITRGELADGQQLPSSRQLSSQLSLARNTVIAVYAQLHDEGLIVSNGRRGTQVRFDKDLTHQRSTRKTNLTTRRFCKEVTPEGATTRTVRGSTISGAGDSSQNPRAGAGFTSTGALSQRSAHDRVLAGHHTALAPGMPDPELFPSTVWRKALSVASRLSSDALGYRDSPLPRLQESLARYLAIYRSLMVEPEQIIITCGTRQSLVLAATLYADPGEFAWVESPGYLGAVEAFRGQELCLQAMRVDQDGCHIDLKSSLPRPALIYLTPCFQYPTGAPLDASRRAAVLAYTQKHNCMIFEDDYDSEFRDDSQARPALASQQAASACHVLHAGTFSKLIFPAARIAWLVVPPCHVQRAQQCLRTLGGGHNSVAQATIAEIIDNGSLAKHLQRARGIYSQRRQSLLAALDDTKLFEPLRDTGGSLSLVARLKTPVSRNALILHRDEQALGVQFLEDFLWDKSATGKVTALVLGLGNVSSIEIPETVARLVRCLQQATA